MENTTHASRRTTATFRQKLAMTPRTNHVALQSAAPSHTTSTTIRTTTCNHWGKLNSRRFGHLWHALALAWQRLHEQRARPPQFLKWLGNGIVGAIVQKAIWRDARVARVLETTCRGFANPWGVERPTTVRYLRGAIARSSAVQNTRVEGNRDLARMGRAPSSDVRMRL